MMKKREIFAQLLLVFLLLLDIFSKSLAFEGGSYWANPGIMLGFLSDLPRHLLILSLSALGGFLFVIYVALMLFWHPRVFGMKLGIVFILAGILGNVIDKLSRGWTLDWITFPWASGQSVAFNLADIYLWTGCLVVSWWLLKGEAVWFQGPERRRIWHSPREQLAFIVRFCSVVVAVEVLLGLVSAAFVRYLVSSQFLTIQGNFLRQFLGLYVSAALLLLALCFMIGLWFSHRLFGPLVAFENYLFESREGGRKDFRLREGDMLKRLETIARRLGPGLVFLILLSWSPTSFAYPHYIGLQYTSCLTCHYNPLGNGPINDYGRGVAATAIAGRWGVEEGLGEEDLVKGGAFPGIDLEKNSWLRPFVGYRGLGIESNAFTGERQRRWVNMQLDAAITLKAGERDQYVASFMLGSKPLVAADSQNILESKSYSREHYLGWRPLQKLGIYVGKMDKAFGLRIPDHNLSSRRATRVAQFDQVHGALVHWVGESLEGALHYFVGDLNEQDEDLHDKGFSATFEWGATERQRFGASIMRSATAADSRSVMAIHDRLGFGKGHSLMAEFGQIRREPKLGDAVTARYALLQTHLMAMRGFWVTGTFDYYRRDTSLEEESLGVGPGIQWFPRQKWELRLDLLNRRLFSETTASEDSWQLLGQVHLWL